MKPSKNASAWSALPKPLVFEAHAEAQTGRLGDLIEPGRTSANISLAYCVPSLLAATIILVWSTSPKPISEAHAWTAWRTWTTSGSVAISRDSD